MSLRWVIRYVFDVEGRGLVFTCYYVIVYYKIISTKLFGYGRLQEAVAA